MKTVTTYKGYTIRRRHFYHVQRDGYTITTASTLASAKRMAKNKLRKSDVNGLAIVKQFYYTIEQNGYVLSNANSITDAKTQINKW